MKKFFFLLLVIPYFSLARTIHPPLSDKIALPIVTPPRVVESRMYDIILEEEKKPQDVHGLIAYYSKKNGVSEKLISNIIRCESGYNPLAKNKRSSAGGLAQFIASTRNSSSKRYGRAGHSRFEAEAAIAVMTAKIKKEGTSAWNASRKCRGK